jgi:hypothetical protein
MSNRSLGFAPDILRQSRCGLTHADRAISSLKRIL